MSRKLRTYVNVGGSWFGPDDVLPDWAVAAITNPDVWAEAPAELAHTVTEPSGQQSTPLADRPKGNASRDTWAAYATSRGVDVPDGMGRDDIIAAVDRANAELLSAQG